MKKISCFILVLITGVVSLVRCTGNSQVNDEKFIRVSRENPRYFETQDGKPWIPVMINVIMPNGDDEAKVFRTVENYFRHFSENGGDAMRIWISSPFLEIEDTRQGEYNPAKFSRIDTILGFAEKYNVKIKFTLQHIRSIKPKGPDVTEWSNKSILSTAEGGTFSGIKEYINTPEGRKHYLDRARALAAKYRDNKQIFSWELWNEMDAVDAEDWYSFSKEILDSVKLLFPHHMVAQTLGSMHSKDADERYEKFLTLENNDYFTVHRYLDPGNDWGQYDNVHGPIDLLISQAVQFVYRPAPVKPVVPNEHGAVEANHTGPNKLYRRDSLGVFIHDMIFAPFFCGASGCGSMWHWDSYVERQNLWFHYKRFNAIIEGIDPVKEKFVPFTLEKDMVRCYGIKGGTTTMIWCRDAGSNWMTELRDSIVPEPRKNVVLDLPETGSYSSARFYDPWNDSWTNSAIKEKSISLPDFTRSIVVVLN